MKDKKRKKTREILATLREQGPFDFEPTSAEEVEEGKKKEKKLLKKVKTLPSGR